MKLKGEISIRNPEYLDGMALVNDEEVWRVTKVVYFFQRHHLMLQCKFSCTL